MSSIINATTSAGLTVTPDNSGQIQFQLNGNNSLSLTSTGVSGFISTANNGIAIPTTSGTIVPISTAIPSWVKRITVMFNQVGTNATSTFLMLQIGSGSFSTSGYSSSIWTNASSGQSTAGFIVFSNSGSASYFGTGVVVLNLIGSNTWIASGNMGYDNVASTAWSSAGRSPALSGPLDRIQITTPLGTAAFTNGSINILYEG